MWKGLHNEKGTLPCESMPFDDAARSLLFGIGARLVGRVDGGDSSAGLLA